MKIIDYKVISGCECLGDLIDMVRKNIKDGWQPLGGVSTCYKTHQTETVYVQAMVKYYLPFKQN